MSRLGIIGAMNLELQLLREQLAESQVTDSAGFTFHTGKIHGKEVVITCCGVGKVNAAACTQHLIDRFGVDRVINTGIAGALHPELRVCDIVISRDATYHDVRKAQMKNLFPFQETFTADDRLIALAVQACDAIEGRDWQYQIGRVVTGEAFVETTELKQAIIQAYAPHCVEMEGAAIAHVAYLNRVPFLIIRSISDNADDQANLTYEEFETLAANQSARLVLQMIELS